MKYTTPWCMHMALIIQFLLASMLVLPGAECSEYYRRAELIHVDANRGFTRGELIRRAAERAHLRAAMLSPADTQDNKMKVAAQYSHFEYLMPLEVDMAGMPKKFLAVADTGSDMVWMKKEMVSPIEELPCSCTRFAFNKTYGSGIKAAKGFICTKKLSFLLPSNTKTETVAKKETKDDINLGFAIHYDPNLMPVSAGGIVGLGRGDLSLVDQLLGDKPKFSYCLSNPLTDNPPNSPFWFGGDPIFMDSELESTPLIEVLSHKHRYYVELLGISIGDGERKELPKDYFNHISQQGNGVFLFIDSGCSHSFLETLVFGDLMNQLVEKLGKSKSITKDEKKHDNCFSPPKAKDPKDPPPPRPDLVLQFKGGAKMRIPWDNYMLQLQDDKPESSDFYFCLTINESSEGVSILGNIQQHNIYMHYDLTPKKEKLSFKRVEDCSELL